MPPLNVWVDIIVLGALWVMVASGLMLVLSIMGILNFAHGQLYMLGAVFAYLFIVKAGVHYLGALLISAVIVATIGVAYEKWLVRPVARTKFISGIAITLAIIFVIEGIVTATFGVGQKTIPTVFPGILKIGNLTLSNERIALIGLATVTMVGLYLFIMKTRLGLTIRAMAQEPRAAALFGVRVGRISSIAMAIGCGLAALAGAFIAPVFYVDAWMGGTPLFMAITAIVIGGLGSLTGAVVGGILLGVTSSLVTWYIGPWSELVAFSLVILIIILRPQGLFGVKPV